MKSSRGLMHRVHIWPLQEQTSNLQNTETFTWPSCHMDSLSHMPALQGANTFAPSVDIQTVWEFILKYPFKKFFIMS